MRTAWKYTLKNECSIEIPEWALPLCVKEQRGEICIWFMVDTKAKLIRRDFLVVGTGHDIEPETVAHLGSVTFNDAALVFHVFEVFNT